MKIKRLVKKEAEDIIVNGKDRGFSIIEFQELPLTIYHREYQNKYYDIAELIIHEENSSSEVVLFYELDPEEVTQLLK